MIIKIQLSKKQLYIIIFITSISIMLILLSIFFKSHFYPGTIINEIDVSYQTTKTAQNSLAQGAASFELILKERGNEIESVKGSEIDLKLNKNKVVLNTKKEQNKTWWIISLLKQKNLKTGNAFTYNEDLLQRRMEKLNCTDSSKIIEPKNATLTYSNGTYYIVKEIYGNKINKEVLDASIKDALRNGKSELNLKKSNCYVNPTIKWNSKKITDTKELLENYIQSKIIYQYRNGGTIVDKNMISQWIKLDNDLNVTFDMVKIMDFVIALADHYNTCGKDRDFITSNGAKIQIGGGDYGWKVDVRNEINDLTESIKKGKIVVKEPRYSQIAATHELNDIGLTYVEIDLTKQHLWYYQAGVLVAQGDVVTGNISNGDKTPEGIYSLKYKVKNAVLRGSNYTTKVTYWMPFNGNIGIHDALWRTQFGRDIYRTRGSHGCINATYKLAETLYNSISAGTPIVCYY